MLACTASRAMYLRLRRFWHRPSDVTLNKMISGPNKVLYQWLKESEAFLQQLFWGQWRNTSTLPFFFFASVFEVRLEIGQDWTGESSSGIFWTEQLFTSYFQCPPPRRPSSWWHHFRVPCIPVASGTGRTSSKVFEQDLYYLIWKGCGRPLPQVTTRLFL